MMCLMTWMTFNKYIYSKINSEMNIWLGKIAFFQFFSAFVVNNAYFIIYLHSCTYKRRFYNNWLIDYVGKCNFSNYFLRINAQILFLNYVMYVQQYLICKVANLLQTKINTCIKKNMVDAPSRDKYLFIVFMYLFYLLYKRKVCW